jgi:hypothetical protein
MPLQVVQIGRGTRHVTETTDMTEIETGAADLKGTEGGRIAILALSETDTGSDHLFHT